MSKFNVLIAGVLVLLVVSIGAFPGPVPRVAQLASATTNASVLAEEMTPDSLASTSTYYTVRPDLRRCAFPRCGGFFVKRVNHAQTRCHNGQLAPQCYVAEIDWNGQPEVGATKAVLRGNLRRYGGRQNLGAFRVSESWEGANERNAEGSFYRAKDQGIRCVTHPCLTHRAALLNSTSALKIAGVDLSDVGARDEFVSEANVEMTKPIGVIVAGSTVRVSGPAGSANSIRASQFYLRAGRQAGPPQKPRTKTGCMVTGCSRQVCSDEEVVTTCEYRPEYACYRRARCERQADGKCGWTQTPELAACLRNPPK